MKLSIISVVEKNNKSILVFLRDLAKQTNQDFELILIIQKSNNQILRELEQCPTELNDKIKIIFNYRDISYEKLLFKGFELSSGDYACVVNLPIAFKHSIIQHFIDKIDQFKTDIIEFKPRLIGGVKFKPKARLNQDVIYDQTNKMFIAYAFPYIFNKLFKRDLINRVLTIKSNYVNNSKFAVELLYYLLFNAQTYKYLDYRVLREQVNSDFVIMTNVFEKTWVALDNYLKINNIKLHHELDYAKAYYQVLLTPGMLTEDTNRFFNIILGTKKASRRTKINLVKINEQILQMYRNNLENFAIKNIYMNSNLKENELLSKPIPLENWNTILKILNE